MKHTKILVYILVLALLLPCLPVAGHAAQEIGFGLSVTPETAAFGSQATVTVSLTGYETAEIAGLQVDITGFDTDVLQVAEYASLIQDPDAASNTVSYSAAHNRVRLLYFRTSGTLAPCTDVLKLVIRIDPALTQAGSITLPVTVKIVTEDSRQITLTSSCTIGYGDISAAAGNSTTGAVYGTLAEALKAAEAGQTVQLLCDTAERSVLVYPDVTLDLNGFDLTADFLVGFDGSHVIDSQNGTGRLIADVGHVVLDEENAMVPVYDGSAYLLTRVGFAIKPDAGAAEGSFEIDAMAYPLATEVVELLKNGGDDNNIEIVLRLTWDSDQGISSQDFTFNDDVVASVYSSNNGSWNSYGRMFSMVVTGIEDIENLKANIIVASGTNAEYVSTQTVDIT